ncbi:translation initiation factor IF-2-like [Teleopsis dalmanni]|uniref:translation initiation factor IF-2-like n=1 Tax=Teleopsis dalmanni TaxID=139649 RepID=UPI0018CCB5E7|nr:translation initiation factor IF-2-like [Teleopsis dalmanni]
MTQILLRTHLLQPLVHQQLPQEQEFATFGVPQMSYNAPTVNAAPLLTNPNEQLSSPIVPEDPAISQALPVQQDSYNMAYQHSSLPHESGYAYQPAPTKVHKHIYVHVPPKDFEEEDAIETRVHHQVGPKQKHYKIVFIKAPSAPAIRAPIVAPPPQNEEKTLIYVLHKKPEAAQDIIIPTAAPTKPSKPEVYFIKYKTKKEEAPVYGPPPVAIEMDPRNADSAINAAPAVEDFAPMENVELSAPLTTLQPAVDEPQPQQFVSELPAGVYGAPTASALTNDEIQSTVTLPNNQYLAPESTQAVIATEAPHVPATNYGPPTRFFIKKRK